MNPLESRMLIGRFDALHSQRQDMEAELDEIEQYIDPIRGGKFFSDQSSQYETQWRRPEIFDSTARKCSINLAANMNSYLTNHSAKWFDLNFRNTELNTNQEAKEWLEECGDRIYEALNDSNFNREMASHYLDLVNYGTAFLMEEVENELDYDGINFQSIPIRESYFEPDHKDQVKHFFRHLQWTNVQIVDKFGRDNCPTDIVDAAEAGTQLDTKESVIFCIWEREEYKEVSDERPVVAPEERQWGYAYLLRSDGFVFDEGGYYEQPAYVTRWEKTSGNYWGFGPGHIALPTVKSVNEMRRLMKVRASKEIDPTIIVEQRNLIGDLDLEPGGVVVVKDINGIKFLFPESNFSIAMSDLDKDHDMIRSIYFADDLMLRDSPQMTATEVMERTERLIKLLGGTFGRLQAGLLDPVVERTFNILFRAGELPEIPSVVAETNERDVLDITYTGALARAQKSDKVINTRRWVDSVKMDAEFNPDGLDVVDFDEMHRGEAELLGVPAKYLKGDEEVDKVRQGRQQQQEAAQVAEQAQAEGDAMQAVGKGEQELRAVE